MCVLPRNASRLRMSATEETELLHQETECQGTLFLYVIKSVEGVLEV